MICNCESAHCKQHGGILSDPTNGGFPSSKLCRNVANPNITMVYVGNICDECADTAAPDAPSMITRTVMTDHELTAIVDKWVHGREHETVVCEAHIGVHFELTTCKYPHFTDAKTRALMNKALHRDVIDGAKVSRVVAQLVAGEAERDVFAEAFEQWKRGY